MFFKHLLNVGRKGEPGAAPPGVDSSVLVLPLLLQSSGFPEAETSIPQWPCLCSKLLVEKHRVPCGQNRALQVEECKSVKTKGVKFDLGKSYIHCQGLQRQALHCFQRIAVKNARTTNSNIKAMMGKIIAFTI